MKYSKKIFRLFFFWNSSKIKKIHDIRFIIVNSNSIIINFMKNISFFISNAMIMTLTKNSHKQMSRAKNFFKIFFQNRKKNEKKTNKLNQLSNDDDRKNKIQKTIFSWKNCVSSNEYFENRNEYRQNKHDKNRDYEKKRYKNKYQNRNKYRDKIRDYEQFDVKFQNARFQKTYTNNYEYENFYADDELYEKINFNEKYDDENSKNQYFYNVIMKFFEICKKMRRFQKKIQIQQFVSRTHLWLQNESF